MVQKVALCFGTFWSSLPTLAGGCRFENFGIEKGISAKDIQAGEDPAGRANFESLRALFAVTTFGRVGSRGFGVRALVLLMRKSALWRLSAPPKNSNLVPNSKFRSFPGDVLLWRGKGNAFGGRIERSAVGEIIALGWVTDGKSIRLDNSTPCRFVCGPRWQQVYRQHRHSK